jgi:hypothetical protein
MRPALFIASSRESLDLAYAVQMNLEDCSAPTVWDQDAFLPAGTILDQLIRSLEKYQFGVFLFSPTDVVRIREREQLAPRDNVVFELGLFIGRLGLERNFIICPSGAALRLPSDLLGLVPATYDSTRPPGEYRAALGPACHSIRLAIQRVLAAHSTGGDPRHDAKTVRYSSYLGLHRHDFNTFGDRLFGESKDKPQAAGAFSIEDGIIVVRRSNTAGRYKIEVRQYRTGEHVSDYLPPNDLLAGQRRFRLTCQVKTTAGARAVHFILKDNYTHEGVDEHTERVSETVWRDVDAELRAKPTAGLFLRIEDRENTVANSALHIRHLILSELP